MDIPEHPVYRATLQGDRDAFEDVIRSASRNLFAIAYAILQNRQEAEDVLQSAYASALRAIGSFEARSTLTTWLTRITINEALARRRVQQRRRKHLALRDVAGMLRSFDYARAVALEHARAGRPDVEAFLADALVEWYGLATNSFIKGYERGLGSAAIRPRDAATRERLLRILQVEKALYELRYELENRPGWVHVPLNGLLALLS